MRFHVSVCPQTDGRGKTMKPDPLWENKKFGSDPRPRVLCQLPEHWVVDKWLGSSGSPRCWTVTRSLVLKTRNYSITKFSSMRLPTRSWKPLAISLHIPRHMPVLPTQFQVILNSSVNTWQTCWNYPSSGWLHGTRPDSWKFVRDWLGCLNMGRSLEYFSDTDRAFGNLIRLPVGQSWWRL